MAERQKTTKCVIDRCQGEYVVRYKRKKIVKMRGTRTCGRGGLKKWRGKGHRGGKGFAGTKKHRKTWIMKYAPDHLGKRGFASKTGKRLKAINLRNLEKLAGDKKEIVLAEFGYDKVLGSGEMKKPLVIKALEFSEKAREKIEKAGGKALTD